MLQNFAPSGFSAPQHGQTTMAAAYGDLGVRLRSLVVGGRATG